MKFVIPIALSAALAGGVVESLGPMGRATNSESSSQRGREAFAEGRFEDAVREFETAAGIKPGPEAGFNLGTSRIAAGDFAGGLESLTTAFDDEALATDVRYNAGWAALGVQDWDNAIRANEEVLRERPFDANAKRNLEIALRKKQEQENQQQRQPQPSPQPQQPEDDESDPQPEGEQQQNEPSDVDSILRSVEQQEKEELDRMRRSRRGRKSDW